MNSASDGGTAFAVSKSSVDTQKHSSCEQLCFLRLKESLWRNLCITFTALLFTFLLLLLLLAQDHRSLGRLLQLAHEGLDVVEAVIEDRLREGEPASLCCSDVKHSQKR